MSHVTHENLGQVECPKCGSKLVTTERRRDGNHRCVDCRHVWKNERALTPAEQTAARATGG